MNTFKAMRTGHKLTLSKLAERTELSISFLSDLESGRATASVASLRKIAACYGVNPSVFLDTPDAPKQTPVPSFQVCHFVMFSCLMCGITLEIKRYGEHHMASSDHCPQCKAYYVVNWETPTEQSAVMLVATDRKVTA